MTMATEPKTARYATWKRIVPAHDPGRQAAQQAHRVEERRRLDHDLERTGS